SAPGSGSFPTTRAQQRTFGRGCSSWGGSRLLTSGRSTPAAGTALPPGARHRRSEWSARLRDRTQSRTHSRRHPRRGESARRRSPSNLDARRSAARRDNSGQRDREGGVSPEGGAYKFRSIYNKVRLLSPEERSRGIVTVSSGNAGIAAAYAARLCGASCLVVMPATPLEEKAKAIEALGGQTMRYGALSTDMFAKAQELIEEEGRTFVHPFDQPEVTGGQATTALELVEQVGDFDVIVVPAGGGSMSAGLSVALRKLKPGVEIIGVQPKGAAGIVLSLKA